MQEQSVNGKVISYIINDGNNQQTATIMHGSNRDKDIIRCLEAIFGGDYSVIPQGDDEVSDALRKVIEKLSCNAQKQMSSVVGLSVQANETAIFSAHMLSNLRKVDEQA